MVSLGSFTYFATTTNGFFHSENLTQSNIQHTQHFTCLYDMEASCVCVSYKPLNAGNNQQTIVCVHFPTRKHAASVGLRLARMNVSSGLSDTYALCNSFRSLAPVSVLCWPVECQFYILPLSTGGSARIVTDALASFFRDSCMLILIRKHHTRAYLTG